MIAACPSTPLKTELYGTILLGRRPAYGPTEHCLGLNRAGWELAEGLGRSAPRPLHHPCLIDRAETEPLVEPVGIGRPKHHPNAAKLFAEFMIGDDAQKVFPTDGGYSVRIDIAPPAGSPDLKSLKIIPLDGDYIERETQRIKRRFNEIFS